MEKNKAMKSNKEHYMWWSWGGAGLSGVFTKGFRGKVIIYQRTEDMGEQTMLIFITKAEEAASAKTLRWVLRE